MPKDFVASLEDSYTGVFAKQEIEGDFVGFEGLVYPSFSRRINVQEFVQKEFKQVICGVDWGYVNKMVCLVCGVDGDGRLHVIEEFYQSKVLIDEFVEVCKQFKEKYGIETFYADPSEPAYIQQMNNVGLNFVAADNEIVSGINKVASYLEKQDDGRPRLFVDSKCVNTVMEFENYRYPESKEGKPVQENPLKVHDHAMDALRYIVNSLDKDFKIFMLEDPEGIVF